MRGSWERSLKMVYFESKSMFTKNEVDGLIRGILEAKECTRTLDFAMASHHNRGARGERGTHSPDTPYTRLLDDLEDIVKITEEAIEMMSQKTNI